MIDSSAITRENRSPHGSPALAFRHWVLVLAPQALAVRGPARTGCTVAAVGAGLLFAGNGTEFYGVLLQDRPNSYAAWASGEEPWIGSDVGWAVFLLRALVLLIDGIITAVGTARAGTRPRWLGAFAVALGPGVLAGSLVGLGPAPVSIVALAAHAAAWLLFGRLLLRRAPAVRPGEQRCLAGRCAEMRRGAAVGG